MEEDLPFPSLLDFYSLLCYKFHSLLLYSKQRKDDCNRNFEDNDF